MDSRVENPFISATKHVFKTMTGIEAIPAKSFLKRDSQILGDVSAIIGITGVAQGSMALVFT